MLMFNAYEIESKRISVVMNNDSYVGEVESHKNCDLLHLNYHISTSFSIKHFVRSFRSLPSSYAENRDVS